MLINLGSNTLRVHNRYEHNSMLDCIVNMGGASKPTARKENIRPYPQHFPVLELRKPKGTHKSIETKKESPRLKFYTLMKPKQGKCLTTQSTHLMAINRSHEIAFRRRYRNKKAAVKLNSVEEWGGRINGWENNDDLYEF
jgi:hypothetical protein